MIGVPYELEEAAKIDGANPIQRYFKIMLPLCVPVLVFIMVTVFNANWSDFYGPLLYLSQEGKDTPRLCDLQRFALHLCHAG